MNRYALFQLAVVRIKQYYREPEAIFWTYGFPLIMVVVLGLAFRNKPEEALTFDMVQSTGAMKLKVELEADGSFKVNIHDREESLERLRKNKTAVVAEITEDGEFRFHLDPTNPESQVARLKVNDAMQRAAGREDAVRSTNAEVTAPGSRYIDFLVPGLIGMNIMGGGLWGVGFVLVDMRVRNLLKRLLATPMKRADFLFSMFGIRTLFFLPEMAFLLLAAFLIFDVPVRGNYVAIALTGLIGSVSFAGLGLLTACRAKRIETISGLMNLVMLPMWLTSGIFFSSERFPDAVQPLIKTLPLTQLINALRALMLDGASLYSQVVPLLILVAWGTVSFGLALKWFRWNE